MSLSRSADSSLGAVLKAGEFEGARQHQRAGAGHRHRHRRPGAPLQSRSACPRAAARGPRRPPRWRRRPRRVRADVPRRGMEMRAIVRAMREGDVEPTRVVSDALRVLARLSSQRPPSRTGPERPLFELVRRAYPYHTAFRERHSTSPRDARGQYPSDVAVRADARLVWDRPPIG